MATRPVPAPVDDLSSWEQFYGFGARPFSLTPDLRFAFHSRSHSQALQQLTDALRRREGIIVITGDIGTGKTMLCRTMLETFERRTFVSVILDPALGVDDLLNQMLGEFGLVPQSEHGVPARPSATRHQMVTMLQRFLGTLVPLNAHAVVIVDEAQQVDPAVLEQLRLLTNFETDAAKLVQVVLVGQPNLDELLGRNDMKQVAQRVARRIELYPLSDVEVERYVDRRLTVAIDAGKKLARHDADGGPSGVEFTVSALRRVATLTGGIPRVINTLCDRTLELAFDRRTRSIDDTLVDAAAERLKLVPRATPTPANADFPPIRPADADDLFGPAGGSRRWTVYGGAGVLAVAVVAGAGAWLGRFQHPAAPVVEMPAAAQPVATTPPSVSPPSTPPSAGENVETPAASPAPSAPGGTIYIAVAAFRTADRAAAVASQLTAAGFHAEARTSPAAMWQQVVVGPFSTADDAAAAQKALTRQGFAGTRVLK